MTACPIPGCPRCKQDRRDAEHGSLDTLKGLALGVALALACWGLLLLALWAFAEVVT